MYRREGRIFVRRIIKNIFQSTFSFHNFFESQFYEKTLQSDMQTHTEAKSRSSRLATADENWHRNMKYPIAHAVMSLQLASRLTS